MRILYLALGVALLFSTLLSSGAYSSGATNITAAINSTRQYLDRVNDSAYLIFYPNLDYAYNALSEAVNVSHTNTTEAFSLLQLATSIATAAQSNLNKYSLVSFYALVIVSVILVIILYNFMKKPMKKPNKRR